MDIITLKSGPSSAELLPKRGALISSLDFGDQKHVLWLPKNFDRASSSWPGGGLPFLFPFAGRVKHQGELFKYAIGQNVYSMPLHGFSWATGWDVLNVTSDSAVLQLASSDLSRDLYPFNFLIVMQVQLSALQLSIEVEISHSPDPVLNTPSNMPVALGWHPYFNIKDHPASLSFGARKAFPVTPDGMAGQPSDLVDLLGPPPWSLPREDFQSLIIGEITDTKVCLSGIRRNFSLEMRPRDAFNYLVTWSNEPSEFICIEPWMSQPNAVAHQTGCRWLAPLETFKAQLIISAT